MKTDQFWDKGIMLVDGCTKVSPGCKNCWSEAMTARFKRVPEVLTDGQFNGDIIINLHLLEKAVKVKKPQVYAIWNDLYHEDVPDEEILMAWFYMLAANDHTFLIVTKRPERVSEYFAKNMHSLEHGASHIWHIVTCENQAMADKRIPELRKVPGKRGIIIEPMLEGIKLKGKNYGLCVYPHDYKHSSTQCFPKIHQVICGPENGAGKRSFDSAWADSVKAQCESAGVPFYRKDKSEGTLAWRASK